MAKAKKPASGSKSGPKAPAKAASAEGQPSSEVQASTAKSDAFTSKRLDSKARESKAPATPVAKTADVKKPEIAAAKSQPSVTSETKPKAAASTSNATKASASKPETAKSAPAKEQPDKIESAKAEPSKPEASKPTVVASAPNVQSTQPQEEERSGGFFPLVIGGLVAGGIGFAASQMGFLNTQSEPQAAFDASQIETSLGAQQDQITALEAVVQEVAAREPAMEGAMPDLSGIEAEIASTSEALAAVSETIAAVEARLSDLENRPAAVADDGSAATAAIEAATAQAAEKYTEELAALQASVEGQKSEIARLLDNALSVEEATANAAQQAAVMGALTKITAALGSGGGFSDAMDELAASGVEDIPVALTDVAADGVQTLLTLQSDFPDMARAALSTARASGAEEGESGLGGFLKRQLGARSVAPREGAGPDAVLSRAEAAVRNGSIADALAEIDTLPAGAQDAMAQWRASAQARADAAAAIEDLSQHLTAK